MRFDFATSVQSLSIALTALQAIRDNDKMVPCGTVNHATEPKSHVADCSQCVAGVALLAIEAAGTVMTPQSTPTPE